MTRIHLVVLAVALAGCPLPDDGDIEFISAAFVTAGELCNELDFDSGLEGEGYSDCSVVFAVEGRPDATEAGCPSCDVEFVVDLVAKRDDCAIVPSGVDDSVLGLSLGLAGDRTWFHDGANWFEWITGEADENSFFGSTAWVGQEGGWALREELYVEWVAPEADL